MTDTTKRRHALREREVLAHVKEHGTISVFWLESPLTRWAALNRLEKRGALKVEVLGYPNYRVTICKRKAA